MKNILLPILFTLSATALAESKYDQEMLRSLGYDAGVAELLEAGAHFLPGQHPVNIVLNGQGKGVHIVTFDQAGIPCWSKSLLQTLGIDAQHFIPASIAACMVPGTDSDIIIEQQVDRSSLVLTVPLDERLSDPQYAGGGKALMVNYDGRSYQYQTHSGGHSRSQTLTSELGANFNHWIIRSGQSYARSGSNSQLTRLYSYGQRSVPGWNSVIQLGEISSSDPLFAGINLVGAQITPEQGLQQGGGNQVSLDILMPQGGTVEIWQAGVLLKNFPVSEGMNRLTGITALNQQDDFVVISHDASGNQQQRIIPYLQAQPNRALVKTATSLAIGQQRLSPQKSSLLMGSTGLYSSDRVALVAGGFVSQNYQAASWLTTLRLTQRLMATLSQTGSVTHQADGETKKPGLSHQISVSSAMTSSLSLNASANFRSRDYIHPGSAGSAAQPHVQSGQIKSQYAAGLSFNQPWLGVFSFAGSQSKSWQGSDSLGYMLGWGRSFGPVNVNLGIQNNRLTDDQRHYDNRYVYLTFSVPLDRNRSVRSWVNRTGKNSRAGVGYDSTVNDKFAWSVSGEKSERQDPSMSGSATWTSKYSQISGGASHSDNNASYNLGARGGAVLHSEGVTFTPRKVGDTFGIISLNSPQPDVAIRTPGGVVWSDRSGHAITSWTAWQKNTVQIDNQSLPKNVQVVSGIADVSPFRGAVVPVMLPAFTVRRALVTFPPNQGPLPGSAIKNDKDVLLAFVNDDGTLFFDDLPSEPLFGQRQDGSRCALDIITPWSEQPGSLYASLSARCLT
ncbi:fimbria/pilus outer membrane usher protein [Pantoea brenneri]|uniref:fimbria/pilus outer membrane usher protein n=1 Tax=Pantoea brenneri TaxID=472694 RepID=UPI002896ABD4|nr:fimbria/pilus outer membrane usher protein [Pantoea brenneri]